MTAYPGASAPPTGRVGADSRQLAAQIAATHAGGDRRTWDSAGELLDAAKLLYSANRNAPVDGGDALLAGIARLLAHGPFPAVTLHAATPGSGIAAELCPDRPFGPPEEDVLLHALALTTYPGGRPWPFGPADTHALAESMPLLTGTIPCRMVPLRAAAIHYLLTLLPDADDSLRRRLLRGANWLLDPRTETALELLTGLIGPGDPLVAGHTPRTRATPDSDSTIAFPVADWTLWENSDRPVRLSGRVHALRVHRRLAFADLRWDSRRAQLALSGVLASQVRVGDLVTVLGSRGTSRAGQPTVFVDKLEYHQSGALPAAPEESGISGVLSRIRHHLGVAGFGESVTPVLTDSYFGGAARPFTTWAAAAQRHQYLRVTTELALLQVIAAGSSRCYEIGPSFRNEGLRGQPAKEFLMLEAYACDLDLDDMADYAVQLVRTAASYPAPLRTVAFDAAFQEISGIDPHDHAKVLQLAKTQVPLTAARTSNPDLLARRLWRSSIRQRLQGLTLVTSIPGATSPLIAGEGRTAQRSWLYADGTEIAEISRNERSPHWLADRFRRQFAQDPHPVHRDYQAVISMFESGVPPCAGLGLSITRLAQLRRRQTPTAIPTPRQEPPR